MPLIKTLKSDPVPQDERKLPRDDVGLVRELEHTDPLARRWAARDLATCPEAAAALVSRLQRENDASVREIILSTLTCLGNGVAVSGLVQCLRSGDAALRNEAIEAMKQLPEEVGAIVRGLLADADADVRIFTVNILESLRHPEVEAWLIEVIKHDQEVNVCATAVDLLAEVGSPAALEPLQQLKMRFAEEPYIQFAADLALKRISEG
ncbi:MAG: HEAT repeat domain-containing protein [Accumulibacter sp.]|uniref:HEAT repeat domain-containing protein n=1 Tax=Accumulibacter sp. TaxID=2053492 RepID=UPI003315F60C